MRICGFSFVLLAVVFALPALPGAAQGAKSSNGANAAGQKPQAKNNRPKTATGTTNCAVVNRWQQTNLQGSGTVVPAAGDFVRQLAGNYDFANRNKKEATLLATEWIAGSDDGLINAVLGAAEGPQVTSNVADTKKKCTAANVTADTNKQTGAPSGSDGTTSTTELTGIPELLSIAVENGSVTNSVNGNTMTLSTSLYGLITGFGLAKDSSHNYDHCRFCVGLGASTSFNVADASSSLTNATRKDISQWQLKYSIFDKSTRSATVKELWDGDPQVKASQLAEKIRPYEKTKTSVPRQNSIRTQKYA